MEKMETDRSFFKKDALILSGVIILLCIITGIVTQREIIVPLITLLTLILIMGFVPEKSISKSMREFILVAFTVFATAMSSFTLNSAGGENYAAESRTPSEIEENMNDDGLAAQRLMSELNDFHRYSGQELNYNAALNRGVSTQGYYWSITNPGSVQFNADMNLIYYDIHKYKDYDDRTIINDLSSVLYYIVPEEAYSIPYGYEDTDSTIYEGHDIFVNTNPVGISFSMSDVMSETSWRELTVGQREEALLYTVVVPDDIADARGEVIPTLSTSTAQPLPDQIDTSRIVNENLGDSISIYIDGVPGCETRVNLEGARFEESTEASVILRSSTGTLKIVDFHSDGYEYYNGRTDFTINMGYSEEAVTRIDLIFVDVGTYEFDNIEVECIPMANLNNAINNLNEHSLTNVQIGTDIIEGDISLNEDRILVIAVPYSEGWSATVDGEDYQIFNADIKYMGLDLPAGSHHVTLTYKTPFFTAGVATSVSGIILLAVLNLINRKKSKQS
jgi:uncharacterized membrane protein YfhO